MVSIVVERVRITMPDDLRKAVDRQARKQRVSRSALIQKAIRSYLGVSRCEELRPLLEEAYRELGEES